MFYFCNWTSSYRQLHFDLGKKSKDSFLFMLFIMWDLAFFCEQLSALQLSNKLPSNLFLLFIKILLLCKTDPLNQNELWLGGSMFFPVHSELALADYGSLKGRLFLLYVIFSSNSFWNLLPPTIKLNTKDKVFFLYLLATRAMRLIFSLAHLWWIPCTLAVVGMVDTENRVQYFRVKIRADFSCNRDQGQKFHQDHSTKSVFYLPSLKKFHLGSEKRNFLADNYQNSILLFHSR